MKGNIIFFLLFFCFTNGCQKQENKLLIKDSLENYQILNSWISKITESEKNIFNEENTENLDLDISNYKTNPSNKIINKLKNLEGILEVKPKIKFFNKTIEVSFLPVDENVGVTFYFFEKKFIFTNYYGGSSSESFIYDFKINTFYRLPYDFFGLNENGNGIISYDTFDLKGSNHPYYDGHIKIDGNLNIEKDTAIFKRIQLEEITNNQKQKIREDFNKIKNKLINSAQDAIKKTPQNKKNIISSTQIKLNKITDQYNGYIVEEGETTFDNINFTLDEISKPFSSSHTDYKIFDYSDNKFIPEVEEKWDVFIQNFKTAYKSKNIDEIVSMSTIKKDGFFDWGGDSANSIEEFSETFKNHIFKDKNFEIKLQEKAKNYKFPNSNYTVKVLGKENVDVGNLIFSYIEGKWFFSGFVGD